YGAPGVQGDDRPGEQPEPHLAESAPREQVGELLRRRKTPHGRGQVRVRASSGQHAPEQRDDSLEPELEERSQRTPRRRDLEHGESSSRPEDAPELTQAPF